MNKILKTAALTMVVFSSLRQEETLLLLLFQSFLKKQLTHGILVQDWFSDASIKSVIIVNMKMLPMG